VHRQGGVVSDAGRPEGAPPGPTGPTGRVLAGRFRVERVLGRGGMGEVLLAHDLVLNRQVAVKQLRVDGRKDSAERRAAVLREARRASQVNDRRIAAIHDVLDLGDELLIVMEFVDGETLRARLHEPLAIDEFWDLSRQCVEALAAAHGNGVIHRDVKPENFMITRDREVKILDFGIAWRTPRAAGPAAEAAATETTEINRGPAGTPLYMAPEAHYGGRIDERTDIFSLGAVFYEMLTARHPFAGDTSEHVLERIMHTTPTPALELNPAVTSELSGVIDRMLARDPAGRFASCADVRRALLMAKRASGEQLSSEETLALGTAVAPSRGSRASAAHRSRVRTWAIAAVAVAVAAAIVWQVIAAPRLPAQRRLAVLLPVTPGASDDFSAYALGTTELLANRLMRHQDHAGFQTSTFAESYDEKLASAADARKAYGANLALRPTLEQRENRLHARLELLEPKRERVLGSRTIDVPVSEPFAFADSLYHAAVALLDLPMRSQTTQADVGIRGPGTLRFLLQGMGRRRAAGTVEARQRALEDFETAYRTEPEPAAPRAWLASAQISLYNATKDTTWLVRAEASAREAVSLDSTRSESHRTLAAALAAQKRQGEALEQYRLAATLDPTDDEAWHMWGRSWQRLGHVDEECGVYQAAIARRPHCFRPRWWLAASEFNRGHIPEAVVAYREMIRAAPEFATGYASLGGMLLLQGAYDSAIDTLRLSLGIRPSAVAYGNLGTAYFNSGRLAQAVEAYNQAFQFGEADYVQWMNLGDAYFWLRNRPDQARDAYRQAVRLGREQIAARAQRGSAPDPMIPALLSTVFPKLGEPDSARVMMRQALALDSLNSRVQYESALTQWQLGSRDTAIVMLRRAVAGGYPIVWIRDSPVHRDWHSEPGFQSLIASAVPAVTTPSPGRGGTR